MSAEAPAAVVCDPLAPTLAEMQDSIKRGLADVAAGRTVDGQEALQRFRALAERLKAGAASHGPAE